MRPDRVITLPVFKTVVTPVARKEWKCSLCKQPIEIGKRYAHYFNRKPHEIISYRFHSECFDMVMAYCSEKHRTTFTPRSVANWIMKKLCESCGESGCQLNDCKKTKAFAKTFKKKH